jgi:DNA polymerase I
MRHHRFAESEKYPIALLCKATAFKREEIFNNYVQPMIKQGLSINDVIAFTLSYDEKGKAPAKFIKEYLAELLPSLQSIGVTHLYVADSSYFKTLTGNQKAEPYYGYVMPCVIKGYEHLKVTLGVNYQTLIFNPAIKDKLNASLDALLSSYQGTYADPGDGIIKSAAYPDSLSAIKDHLQELHKYPHLTCDIEAFSLRFWEAGIGTISFAWDEHHGIAFAVDYEPFKEKSEEGFYGQQTHNPDIRILLKEFFESYKGEITFHHAAYDVKILIAQIWMKDWLDTAGLLVGLNMMCANMHDSKVITYLAVNSTAGNQLGLKTLAQEFAGNWAQEEIKDIRKIPLPELLKYNLVDALATHYVHKKFYPVMVADCQEELYKGLFLSSLKLIIQMELTGMPISIERLAKVKAKLETIREGHTAVLDNHPLIATMNHLVRVKAMETANAKLKVKQHPLSHFAEVKFNPGSGPQLQRLLYEQLGLPVIDLTDTKLPATGAETLEKLINHTNDPSIQALLNALIGLGQVEKILSTFIPAFEKGLIKAKDGIIWLHGSFNLGGAVSGRLSSSDPNLQNIPSNSIFAKLIKEIFLAPKGWLFTGADFNSLEDMISALTTKDPNKLRVYSGFKQYNVTVNGIVHRIRETDVVSFDGQQLNGEQLYEKLQDSKP